MGKKPIIRKPKPVVGLITGKYVGRRDISCAGLVHSVLYDIGTELPKSLGDLTLDNYMERFRQKPLETQSLFLRGIKSIGQYADPKHIRRWDVVVLFSMITKRAFPAVAISANKAMAVSESHGVEIIPMGNIWRPIVARRVCNA